MSWYRTGTVSVTNGNATVTGAGTAFVASVRAGYGFVGPDGRTYEIDAVVSDTQITLAATYQGATAAGQAYAIFPTQSVIADLATSASELIDSFADVRDGVGAGLNPDGSAATPAIRFAADQDTGIYRYGGNAIGFAVGGAHAGHFASSGALVLTGLSVDVSGGSGVGQAVESIVSPSSVAVGAVAGGIGIGWGTVRVGMRAIHGGDVANAGLAFETAFGGTITERLRILASGEIYPSTDNVSPLGTGSNRFTAIFATSGTVSSSDERDKTWRGPLSDAEYAAGRRAIETMGFYQWNDAVAEKGPDGARYHFGVKAQEIWSIFADEGLVDPLVDGRPGATPYAFLCWDEWDEQRAPAEGEDGVVVTKEAGHRFGIRPEQLALFLTAVQARQFNEIEARIAALETASS